MDYEVELEELIIQDFRFLSQSDYMDSGRGSMSVKAEGDRLSVLPDDLILKILSFVGLKDVVGTSVLSSRWRYLWTSIPHLSLSSQDFSTVDKFSECVTHVLSRLNNQVLLSSFKLHLSAKDGEDVAQRVMDQAFSLSVQQLNIKCVVTSLTCVFQKKATACPLSVSGSQTLEHLTLSCDFLVILTSTREFSSLTTLHLHCITLDDGFLSMCPNLENLTLHCCKITGSEVLRICHPRLSNLTLENGHVGAFTVNVVTPQLKNLTISDYLGGFQINAPELASLLLIGFCPSMFSTDGFHSLEEAQLSFHILKALKKSDASTIISLLQKFHYVKRLSLSIEIIQLLNSCVDLISRKPSPLANLESLKILPKMYCLVYHKHVRVVMSTKLRNYLLNGSPKATLTEVLRAECCDITACADPPVAIKKSVSFWSS